jgi:hypothetical protein
MVAVELAVSTLMRSLLQASGREAAKGVGTWLSRRFDRAGRRRAYVELQVRVAKARLRATLALQLQSQVVNTIIPLGGLQGALVGVLDHSATDMSDVLAAWLTARHVAPERLAEAADELVLALAGLLAHPDPGWWRPRRRASAHRLEVRAAERFDAALGEFVRLVTADTGKTRAERKAAQRRRPT